MKSTQNALASLIKAAACAILALGAVAQAQDKKADPTGTWTWSTPGRDGRPERKFTLKLKLEGEKVTGTLSAPGRGGQSSDVAISDGKLSGDTIKGKMEFERNGQTQSRDWEAKRETEKK